MSLIINIRHLENRNLELCGELPLAELDLNLRDDLIRATHPLHYDLEIEMLEDSLLVQGLLRLNLECQCVRCLKDFDFELELDPWTLHIPFEPLEDEETLTIKNDCVDLTPQVREDILLGFPQHPLCRPDCDGLKKASVGKARKTVGKDESKPSAWAELNKLKL
ncbi:MAG: YceD family protein [Limisphaerales bacterium]